LTREDNERSHQPYILVAAAYHWKKITEVASTTARKNLAVQATIRNILEAVDTQVTYPDNPDNPDNPVGGEVDNV